jgi:hypothetical protein
MGFIRHGVIVAVERRGRGKGDGPASALIEEATLNDPGSVLSSHGHVGR